MTTLAYAVLEFDGTPHSCPADPLGVVARLTELWDENRPPLDWLATAFARWYARDLPRPFLFAAAGGVTIQATWSLPPHAPSLDIDLERQTGVWDGTGRAVDLSTAAGWAGVCDTLRELRGDTARQSVAGC